MGYIKECIEQTNKENVKFVFPMMRESEIGKYISAFANTNGGVIIFGARNNGNNIEIKGYRFSFNIENIIKEISSEVVIKTGTEDIEGQSLIFIKIEKSEKIVSYQNKNYVLDKSKKVVELKVLKIFLSYNHNDSKIVNDLELNLNNLYKGRIELTRDINVLDYKGSLDEFMQTIKDHDLVISIISDTYLKSTACMYEVSELMRDRNYIDKLLFITVKKQDLIYYENGMENAKAILPTLYGIDRFNYILYWEEHKSKIDEIFKKIKDTESGVEISLESRLVRKISINVSEFIEQLKDRIGKGYEDFKVNNFEEIRKILN